MSNTNTSKTSRMASMEEDTRAELPQGLATLQEKREGIINFVPFKCKMTTFTKMNISKYVEKAKCSGNGKCNGIAHHEQHEAIFAECMPYFDFDVKLKDRDELIAFQGKAEGTIKGTFIALFPHCKLFCSTSHGSVKDKDNEIWKFSMHVVMRGDGYFSNAPNVKKFYIKTINDTLAKSPVNGIKIVCDPVPYHNGRQLLRCLFANKYPNIRHEDYKNEGDKTDFRTFHPCEWFKDTDNYKYYFAQYIGDEDLSEHDGQEGIHSKEDKYFTRSGPSALDVFNDDDNKFITNKDDMEILEEKGAKKTNTNNTTAEGEGDEIILTLEELTEVVNALKTDRFKDYNEWCHLLWIVTRYCDKMNYDPDDAWELLEDFCKTCEGWQKGAVRKKMNEANKFSDTKQIKKMGTVLMWLKEDNKEVFNKYVKSKITQIKTTVTEFDKMNPYVWIDFREEHEGIVFPSSAELDNSIKTKINLVLARISEGSGIYLKKDGVDNISSIETLGKENFTVFYESKNKKGEVELRKNKLLDYIETMRPPPLKLYSKMGCFPLKESCPRGVYNVWYGIKAQEVKEVDEEKIKPFLYILKTLWANDDERVYKYLIAWFRMAICEPEKMIRVALFLYSKKEGTGKGRIVDFITEFVLGPAVCHIFTGMDQVLTEHNTNIAGKKIICINEMAATKKEFLSNFDKLKPIISDKYISENPKFQKITQVENITNVIMCTQHKNSIYIKRGNRRFTCLEVSDKKKEDENFWNDLSKNYMNQEAGNHFYTWLLRQDKTQLPNPSILCETKLRKEIIQISHDNTESFMDIITKNDGEDSDEFGQQTAEIYELSRKQNDKDGLYYIKCSDMYNIYKSYCGECGEHPKTLNAFKSNSDIENVLTIKQIDGIKHYRVL